MLLAQWPSPGSREVIDLAARLRSHTVHPACGNVFLLRKAWFDRIPELGRELILNDKTLKVTICKSSHI